MCGITGIVYTDPTRRVEGARLKQMNQTLRPRGPDQSGLFIEKNVGLAMRRLAIIDVASGQQPITNEDQTVIVINNGEIYNFQALRQTLEAKGHCFFSHTDTEVLPHLYEVNGLDFVLQLNGMFALALWDKNRQRLLLARDRMGKKPLYYYYNKEGLWFASELKALLACPEIPHEIDPNSLQKYLAYEYLPAPRTIFKNIWKLPAGYFGVWEKGQLTLKSYWDIPLKYNGFYPKNIQDAQEEFAVLLKQAVRRRLISDVPLGAFLSGGIDSSTVVALMAESLPAKQIKTFSIGFEETSFDESPFAQQVANYFGVDHYAETLSLNKALTTLPEVVHFLDEPLGDPSILPTYLLSKFTRQYVTVALGGDGGDELLAGYQTFLAAKWARAYETIPSFVRNNLIERLVSFLPTKTNYFSLDFKLKQFLRGLAYPMPLRHLIWTGSFNPEELRLLLGQPIATDELFSEVRQYPAMRSTKPNGNQELYLYKKLYLQDDILTKVDRASMACSLEVRAPFLDKEVVEFLSPLPFAWKLKGLTTKYLLKRMMKGKLPKPILRRKKQGFAIPVAQWLKKELKDQAWEALHPTKLRREGLFNPDYVSQLLKEHTGAQANHAKKLWTLLMFEWWLEKWGRGLTL